MFIFCLKQRHIIVYQLLWSKRHLSLWKRQAVGSGGVGRGAPCAQAWRPSRACWRSRCSPYQAAPNVRLAWTRRFCTCGARRGNLQCLAKSSPCAGPSAGTEVARLRKWHVWCLLVYIRCLRVLDGTSPPVGQCAGLCQADPYLRGTKGVPRKGFEHRFTRGFEHVKNREKSTIRPVVTYDPPVLGTPLVSSRLAASFSRFPCRVTGRLGADTRVPPSGVPCHGQGWVACTVGGRSVSGLEVECILDIDVTRARATTKALTSLRVSACLAGVRRVETMV